MLIEVVHNVVDYTQPVADLIDPLDNSVDGLARILALYDGLALDNSAFEFDARYDWIHWIHAMISLGGVRGSTLDNSGDRVSWSARFGIRSTAPDFIGYTIGSAVGRFGYASAGIGKDCFDGIVFSLVTTR
eukprot:68006_1